MLMRRRKDMRDNSLPLMRAPSGHRCISSGGPK